MWESSCGATNARGLALTSTSPSTPLACSVISSSEWPWQNLIINAKFHQPVEIFVNVRRQQDKHKDDTLNYQVTDVEHLMKSALCTHHPSKSMSAEDDQNFVEDTQYFRKSVSRSIISSTTSQNYSLNHSPHGIVFNNVLSPFLK